MTPPPRKPSTPGQYAYVPEDDVPTRPDGAEDPGQVVLSSVYRQESALDRRRLVRLVEAWHSLTLDQRILIESLAFEMARVR